LRRCYTLAAHVEDERIARARVGREVNAGRLLGNTGEGVDAVLLERFGRQCRDRDRRRLEVFLAPLCGHDDFLNAFWGLLLGEREARIGETQASYDEHRAAEARTGFQHEGPPSTRLSAVPIIRAIEPLSSLSCMHAT
jgi:hypothetical protein